MNIKHKNIGNQKGMTIISLMMGLFISMLCILASLTLYKNLIRVAADAKVGAMHDGQLSTAMLTLEKYILTAGFGIDNAGVNDMVIRTIAAVAIPETPGSTELLWRYNQNGVYICTGLMERNQASEGRNYRMLTLRQAAVGCNATVGLVDLDWADVATIAQWPVIGVLETYIANNDTLLSFSLDNSSCSPFGSSDAESRRRLNVTAPNSASLNGGINIVSTDYQYCLPNLYTAAP